MSTSQNCIHIQKVSSMFRIDLDVCREFIESGLIEVTVQFDEEYIATQELGKVQRIVSLYRDLGVNREGIEIILAMKDKLAALNDELNKLKQQLETRETKAIYGRMKALKKKGLYLEQ